MDSVYLAGSEDVRAASRNIASAAETMQRAASQIDEALARHERFLDDWLMRFAAAMPEPQATTMDATGPREEVPEQ